MYYVIKTFFTQNILNTFIFERYAIKIEYSKNISD